MQTAPKYLSQFLLDAQLDRVRLKRKVAPNSALTIIIITKPECQVISSCIGSVDLTHTFPEHETGSQFYWLITVVQMPLFWTFRIFQMSMWFLYLQVLLLGFNLWMRNHNMYETTVPLDSYESDIKPAGWERAYYWHGGCAFCNDICEFEVKWAWTNHNKYLLEAYRHRTWAIYRWYIYITWRRGESTKRNGSIGSPSFSNVNSYFLNMLREGT